MVFDIILIAPKNEVKTMSYALSTISMNTASKKLNQLVSNQWIGISARACGFVKRRGSLNPVKLLKALLAAVGTPQPRETIQSVVAEYNSTAESSERIFYKPLHNRLRSDGCVKFMATFVGKLQEYVHKNFSNTATQLLIERMQAGGLPIDDIYLHDGTYWHLKDCFSNQYPGTRSHKKAVLLENTYNEDGTPVVKEPEKTSEIGLQTTYSMKAGTIIDVSVTSGTANETQYVKGGAGKSILHLMDAGYGRFELLKNINACGEYFITKLKSNSAATIITCHIDGDDFSELFAGKKLSSKEFRTFREHSVVDLTVRLSDGSIYRAVRFYSKKEHQARNFITNIDNRRITAHMISVIYKIRWKIELVFKDLKSGSNLTGVDTSVINIVFVMLFASLAAHFIKQLVAGLITAVRGREVSLYRLTRYSASWLRRFLNALFGSRLKDIKSLIKDLDDSKGTFEPVKQSRQKHLALKTLKSVYCYLYGNLTPNTSEAFLLEA